ncbi:MAG TPA: hypothetical protein PLZ91_05935, partial [Bacteroidia bacterium]|nr:hypothetical protein [Bacteroidia bacterium]
LGNNLSRFGLWEAEVNWMNIFRSPELYLEGILTDEEIELAYKYIMPEELRKRFSNSISIDFDIKKAHQEALDQHHRPRVVIEKSTAQHLKMCIENSSNLNEALALAELLKEEIDYRVRVYARCLSKTSESYVKWMQDEYKRNLKSGLFMNNIRPMNQLVEDNEIQEESSEEGDVIAGED